MVHAHLKKTKLKCYIIDNVSLILCLLVGLTHLLSGLLNPSPAKRLTVKDCQRDIWTNQPVDASQYSWEEVLPNCGKKMLFLTILNKLLNSNTGNLLP